MSFDLVHDTQKAYRKVVNSMSRPGTINTLKDECEILNLGVNINKGALLLMMMLLDREVTYSIECENKDICIKEITQLTYSKCVNSEDADFLFILKDVMQNEVYDALEKTKIGTLIDPQKSATVIYEVDDFDNGHSFELKGPGIDGKIEVSLNLSKELLKIRDLKNWEYPLGIDFIFIDSKYRIICIPRTTVIRKKER